MRFAKFDRQATKAAKFKNRFSRIGVRFDGTQLIRLEGKDMTALREEVFERDQECVDRAQVALMGKCAGPHELSHEIPRGRGGTDTAENTKRRCRAHHRYRDLHGMPGHF